MSPTQVNFGKISRSSATVYQTITLERGDGGPISPEILAHSVPGLGAQVCEIEPGELYELEVWLGPPWPQDRFRDVLRLKTGVEEDPETTLVISGYVAPRLGAAPNRLTFPTTRPEPVERSVRLQWEDGPPANILEATSSVPDSTVRIDQDSRGHTLVAVTLPASTDAMISGSQAVTIKTDDPVAPVLSVPITFDRPDRAAQGRRQGDRTTVRSSASGAKVRERAKIGKPIER